MKSRIQLSIINKRVMISIIYESLAHSYHRHSYCIQITGLWKYFVKVNHNVLYLSPVRHDLVITWYILLIKSEAKTPLTYVTTILFKYQCETFFLCIWKWVTGVTCFKITHKTLLYGALYFILTSWPKISCKKMIMNFYHESIHENK